MFKFILNKKSGSPQLIIRNEANGRTLSILGTLRNLEEAGTPCVAIAVIEPQPDGGRAGPRAINDHRQLKYNQGDAFPEDLIDALKILMEPTDALHED